MSTVLPPLHIRPTPNQSARRSKVHLVVVHDTEGGYDGACSWLCNPRADASAHVVLREDGLEATQLVPWGRKAWSCMAYNDVSDNLEMAGYASKGYRASELKVAARIVAYRLHKRGLPARLSKGKRSGVAFHQDLGALGGGHSDPGFSRAKKLWFVYLVRRELKRGGFRDAWGD